MNLLKKIAFAPFAVLVVALYFFVQLCFTNLIVLGTYGLVLMMCFDVDYRIAWPVSIAVSLLAIGLTPKDMRKDLWENVGGTVLVVKLVLLVAVVLYNL